MSDDVAIAEEARPGTGPAAGAAAEAAEQKPLLVVPVAAAAWGAVAALFLAMHAAPVFLAPVGGAELAHLSGAWEARTGDAGARFVPTLFQWLTSLVLHVDTGETLPRLLAFVSTATVPAAVYMLRRELGRAGALVALLLLALDAPTLLLGSTASAMGFDIALTVWLLVVWLRPGVFAGRPWLLAVGGFAAATAGPVPLPLLAGMATVHLWQRRYPSVQTAAWLAAGAVAGVLAASFRFGGGWDGLRVPPFDVLSADYGERWSTATGAEVMAIYGLPLLAAGVGAWAWVVARAARGAAVSRAESVLTPTVVAAGVWWVTAANAHDGTAVAATLLPMALLAGPALARAAAAMVAADWSVAKFLAPTGAFAALMAAERIVQWSRPGAAIDAEHKALIAALLALAAVCLGIVALNRTWRPTLLAAGIGVAVLPVVSGAVGVALAAPHEPLPSPVSAAQARDLRGVALATAGATGGPIVVHPTLRDAIVWPFRDSGDLLVLSRVDPAAAVAILPASAAAPPGMIALEGQWAVTREVVPPESGLLRYVRWFVDRNGAEITSERISVYRRASK